MVKRKGSGQITTRKIGKSFIVCVRGNPEHIFSSENKAKLKANELRKKAGRRIKKD